ncbi:hypothetical protein J6590_103593, partial [Homalodisca vitripennis]
MKVSVKNTHKWDRSLSIHIKDGSLVERSTINKALTKGYSEDGDVEIDLTSLAAKSILPTPHHHTPPL